MGNVKRYELHVSLVLGDQALMVKSNDGKYVRYSDIAPLVEGMPSKDALTQASRVLRFKSEQLTEVADWLSAVAEWRGDGKN